MPSSTLAPAPLTDRDTFLEAVRAAGILTPKQQAKAEALAPVGSASAVATELVAAELVTRFQADRLLAGCTDGFLLGPYVLLEPVGRGAKSRVYKAKHRTMNRPVAIKVLAASLTRAPAARETFQFVVRAAGRLTHPNIVTAYDASESEDHSYLVLEFVDGPNLDALVRRRGPLPVADACEFVRQTAAGLRHAHELGMAHLDIKPANLLVARPTPSAPLTVKIADFGLPKVADGPNEYTAPDPAGADGFGADLYALGAVFYFLLTGRAPQADVPVPVGRLRSDVPREVTAVVHKLMAKDPAERFESATELLAHLDGLYAPAARSTEEVVSFDLPAAAGQGSGQLTGRSGQSSDIHVEVSLWAQLTAEGANGDTIPYEIEDTPAPSPRKGKTRGRGESVPLWMTAVLLVGVVLLCLMGIGAVVRLLAK